MKRLLRSVIDFDGSITQENLVLNFQKLLGAAVVWGRDDDDKVFKRIRDYFQQYLEMPSGQTLTDYFDGLRDIETVERLKDLRTTQAYIRTNFSHLLTTILEEQNKIRAVALLKEAHEILTKGIELEGQRKFGVKDGLMHFAQHANDLIVPDFNARTGGDIRLDAQAMIDEYTLAENSKDKVWGAFTGIHEIDEICRGLKKGELHIHAGFPGELKCLPGDAMVFDHRTNRRRRLEELYACKDLPVVTALEKEGAGTRLVVTGASHLVQNGRRKVFDLELQSGRSVGATSNHKFFTPSGWKLLSELSEGDFVATPRIMEATGASIFSEAEIKVIGYLIGDGCLGHEISFTQKNPIILEDFLSCIRQMGFLEGSADYEVPNFRVNVVENGTSVVRVAHGLGDRWHRVVSPLRVLLERFDLFGKNSYEKRIPSEFFGLPLDMVGLLLGALWSTDGSCCTGDWEREGRSPQSSYIITYSSVSRGLCQDIQSLLLRFGIQSTVTTATSTLEGEEFPFWTTRIVTNPSKRLFCEKIRVIGKELQFAHLLSRLPERDTTLIPSCLLPDGERVKINGSWRYARTSINYRNTVTSDVAQQFGVDTGDIYWDRVCSVSFRGVEMTYDLSVPEHHTFVVNDIITHNSTFAANWCYNLCTHYKKNVVFVSLEMPYEQVRRQLYTIHSANMMWQLHGHRPLDYRKIRDGELTPEEKVFYFDKVIPDFNTNPNYTHFHVMTPDREMTMENIRMEVELLHKQFEVGLVVIDHGQWVEARKGKKSDNYVVELNSVVRDAKRFALHFNHREGVPILLLWQINREGKEDANKNDGVYRAKALTYANECEKTADVITATYLNDDLRKQGATKLTNMKNRDNPLFDPFLARINFISRRMTTMDKFANTATMGADDHESVLDLAGV